MMTRHTITIAFHTLGELPDEERTDLEEAETLDRVVGGMVHLSGRVWGVAEADPRVKVTIESWEEPT